MDQYVNNLLYRYVKEKDKLFAYLDFLIFEKTDDVVISILDSAPPIRNIVDAIGQTLLHSASKHNNTTIIKYLVRSGCDINSKDKCGWTPLMDAAEFKHTESIEMLLSYSADIFITNSKGQSALQKYMNNRNFRNPDSTLDMFFGIVKSIYPSIIDQVAILKLAKCNLHAIVHFRDGELTKEFLNQQSHIVDFESNFSVLICMERNYEENLRILLRYGVDFVLRRLYFIDFFKSIMYETETSKGILEIIKNFLQIIIDLQFFDRKTANFIDALFLKSNVERLSVVLDSDINSYIKKEFGHEPIVHIFGNKNPGILQLIEKNKININVRSSLNSTSLHMAVDKKIVEHVHYLLEMGVDPNVTNDFCRTPIFKIKDVNGRFDRHNKILPLLLRHGADLQVCDIFGCTIVEYLAYTEDCKSTFETMLAHLAMVKSLNVSIKEPIIAFIHSNNHLNDFYEKMGKQLERMKKHNICKSLNLFTVLTTTDEYVSHRIRAIDSDTVEGLCFYAKYRLGEYHTYYTDILRDRILTAYSICRMRDKAAAVICECIEVLKCYFVVVNKICNYLTSDDLQKIAYPNFKQHYK